MSHPGSVHRNDPSLAVPLSPANHCAIQYTQLTVYTGEHFYFSKTQQFHPIKTQNQSQGAPSFSQGTPTFSWIRSMHCFECYEYCVTFVEK